MKNFTSSARPLTFYADSAAIRQLMEAFGDRLAGLIQEEKFQLSAAISVHLWQSCESSGDYFLENFGLGEFDDVVESQDALLGPDLSVNATWALVILRNESPEILAQLLPAIAQYAADDDR
jgi:hypothetical protein